MTLSPRTSANWDTLSSVVARTMCLDRYFQAAKQVGADIIVRITGDCPLMDPVLVDRVISAFKSSGVEYACNIDPPTYPDGLDVEIFSFQSLEKAWKEAAQPAEREHVTPYLRESGKFRTLKLRHSENLSGERWTVDEPEDFDVVAGVFEYFYPRNDFGWQEVLQLRQARPEMLRPTGTWFAMKERQCQQGRNCGNVRSA